MDLSKLNKISVPDKGFPKRVLKTSIILSFVFIIYSFYFNSLEITYSLALGIGISIGTIYLLWRVLKSVYVLGDVGTVKKRAKHLVTLAGVCKYIFVSFILFFVFRHLKINLIALFIGVSIVQIVIVFKMLGFFLINYLNKTNKTKSNNSKAQLFGKLN